MIYRFAHDKGAFYYLVYLISINKALDEIRYKHCHMNKFEIGQSLQISLDIPFRNNINYVTLLNGMSNRRRLSNVNAFEV